MPADGDSESSVTYDTTDDERQMLIDIEQNIANLERNISGPGAGCGQISRQGSFDRRGSVRSSVESDKEGGYSSNNDHRHSNAATAAAGPITTAAGSRRGSSSSR